MKKQGEVPSHMLVALNPYYAMAVFYLTLGALAAVEMVLSNFGIVPPMPGEIWVRVHTIVLGGMAQFAFGTLPGIVARRVGAPEPDRATQWRLWALLNISIVLVLVGMVSNQLWIFGTGATVALLADLCLFRVIWQLGSKGTGENRLAARFYATGVFYLFLGILMALTLKLGWPPAPGGIVGAREAHIHANAWGFLNVVIGVSIFELMPRLFGRPLAFPQLNKMIWWGLSLGGFLLILGPWAGEFWITATGLVPYLAMVVLLYINIIATALRGKSQNPFAMGHLIAAYFWIALPAVVAPFVLLMGDRLPVSRIELVAVQSLISGWALQIAMAFVPMALARFQSGEPAQPCNQTAFKVVNTLALIAVNVGAGLFWVAGLAVPDHLYGPVLGTGYALVAFAWIPFLGRTWRTLVKTSVAAG